ncbi:MAG TPA: TIGR03557 family F420-dependent LLM class oxidoreductase [Acidimicrobiales bacterium]|nr:TIGR03557 family F420-dependent LLM class oxidoreductase [Acidimicrobiales bacterium]
MSDVVGIFLSSEEHPPLDLVRFAGMAEEAGLTKAWISDHYHPWTDAQGQSPFVWSVIGGIAATTQLTVTTAVTCPTVRIHPAVVAQAAATSAAMLPGGRFRFGVGSGENLNEHILGDGWPPTDIRLEMLEEAIDLIRELWQGKAVTWDGKHYVTHNAKLYTLPDEPPPVLVSGFGEKAIELAARIGDGFVSTSPDADHVAHYERSGGKGLKQGGVKVCWGPEEEAAKQLAHELWPNSAVGGELSQELPMPAHFEQASAKVTPDEVAESIPCGPDPERHVQAIRAYLEAGFDEVYVSQVGPDQAGFLAFCKDEVLPRL